MVIAEGVVVVERLFASPYPVRALLGVARRHDELAAGLAPGPGRAVPFYVATAEVMAAVVGFHLNRGVLATADRSPVPDLDAVLRDARTLAVTEGVGDHENLGSLFRNAAALGVDAVVLGPGCTDPLYRRAIRVSMGNVFRVPFLAPGLPVTDLIGRLRSAGFRVAALSPRPDALPISDAGLARGRVAVLLGAEGPGLTDEAMTAADVLVRIPLRPGVDSLNVATAGAIAFAALDATSGRLDR